MTTQYTDVCPACRSRDVLPYAVIVGGSEEYGYQCLACQVSWPVLSHAEPRPASTAPPIGAVRHAVSSA